MKPESSQGIGLYIHIPFCATKCPYCDFNTYARIEDLMPSYLGALNTELRLWASLLGRPSVKTIFFGGGTPSYLPLGHISSLLNTIRAGFNVHGGAEITLEANPDDFTRQKLKHYLPAGGNRLSIGVQSLDDRLLKTLGRRHSSQQAIQAYKLSREAGFGNVSLDLMYGLPNQSIEDWKATLEGILELKPEHLSCYCLTLEKGTPLESLVKEGKVPEPDSDLAADMYLLAEDTLEKAGFAHYEISNWARPGLESRHNLVYWHNQPYLGVGPGAHSYIDGIRFYNLKSPRDYIQRLASAKDAGKTGRSSLTLDAVRSVPTVEEAEAIGQSLEMAETMMMGLRLQEGIAFNAFKRRFGTGLRDVYSEEMNELKSLGLLDDSNAVLRLTPQGRLLGNEVFQRFVAKGKAH